MSKNNTEEVQVAKVVQPRRVRNRNNYKIELSVDGKILVFPPRRSVVVPDTFELPEGLGLYFV